MKIATLFFAFLVGSTLAHDFNAWKAKHSNISFAFKWNWSDNENQHQINKTCKTNYLRPSLNLKNTVEQHFNIILFYFLIEKSLFLDYFLFTICSKMSFSIQILEVVEMFLFWIINMSRHIKGTGVIRRVTYYLNCSVY